MKVGHGPVVVDAWRAGAQSENGALCPCVPLTMVRRTKAR